MKHFPVPEIKHFVLVCLTWTIRTKPDFQSQVHNVCTQVLLFGIFGCSSLLQRSEIIFCKKIKHFKHSSLNGEKLVLQGS